LSWSAILGSTFVRYSALCVCASRVPSSLASCLCAASLLTPSGLSCATGRARAWILALCWLLVREESKKDTNTYCRPSLWANVTGVWLLLWARLEISKSNFWRTTRMCYGGVRQNSTISTCSSQVHTLHLQQAPHTCTYVKCCEDSLEHFCLHSRHCDARSWCSSLTATSLSGTRGHCAGL
jgi:hypothetical protein